MQEPAEIPLNCWCDPQGDSLLVYSAEECSIYRGCWIGPDEPADFICHLSFHDVKGVRSFPREFVPYEWTPTRRSTLLCPFESEMIHEHIAYRTRHYPTFVGDISRLRHYVVHGHDFYHEILATGFTETSISKSQLADERLVRFFNV